MSTAQEIVTAQREHFRLGKQIPVKERIVQLRKLNEAVERHYSDLQDALKKDLNKSSTEAILTELGIVSGEIKYLIKHLKRLTKPKKVKTPIVHFRSTSKIYMEPYGCILIMAPWNYPVQLSLVPLAGALAAGNRVVLKPSSYAPETSHALKRLLNEIYPEDYVAVVEGGRDANKELLDQHFDYIFFTGSVGVGKFVMEKASVHLTPITLELGGKSPTIVDESADIKIAAARIIWGKTINAGQTCVAPDYVLVHKSKRDELVKEMKEQIKRFWGNGPEKNPMFPCIVNMKHFERIKALLDTGNIAYGGGTNIETRQIAPTLMIDVTWESEIMQDEIFGPILPIMTYTNLDEIIKEINSRPKPLACYIFTSKKDVEKKLLNSIAFGGGCVNDTVVHLANNNMPFGGVGYSGMGGYHGKYSIETFSHRKSVLKKGTGLDLALRYPPYDEKKNSFFKKIM